MSAANVQFHLLEISREHLWAKDRSECEAGKEQTFSFDCPKYKRRCGDLIIVGRTSLKHDPSNQNGGVAQWNWDGNRTAPTFTPSVNCTGCWHGFIRNGRCVTAQGIEEPELHSKEE
jgi:Family of unknown function (DUF6527)